jgi:glucose dehydrogenase
VPASTNKGTIIAVVIALGLLGIFWVRKSQQPAPSAALPPAQVDQQRLSAANAEPGNWYTGGRDQDGTYYSPLDKIDASNVARLGFVER